MRSGPFTRHGEAGFRRQEQGLTVPYDVMVRSCDALVLLNKPGESIPHNAFS